MQIDWEKFNPEKYVAENYSFIHDEDKKILDLMTEFYLEIPMLNHALEVGVGPNLYPLMAMLPKAKVIKAMEYSQRNINYLRHQLIRPSSNWNIFQEYLISNNEIYRYPLPQTFATKVNLQHGSIYELPEGKFDLVSMNFVAESITNKQDEFNIVCQKFVDAVKPGGNLIASFMENSVSYTIDGIEFPSYPIDLNKLDKVFSPITTHLKIQRIEIAQTPLRPGYTGMLFLTGRNK
jgi:hypothetical protein